MKDNTMGFQFDIYVQLFFFALVLCVTLQGVTEAEEHRSITETMLIKVSHHWKLIYLEREKENGRITHKLPMLISKERVFVDARLCQHIVLVRS